MEIIIAHLIPDLGTLKTCSLTCRSWYTATASHLHHTLTLVGDRPDVDRSRLEPLSKLHGLGLIPLVKSIRIKQDFYTRWFVPHAFSHLDLSRFSALTNVHTLKLQSLDIPHFIPDIERHFGHFSQSLRSITLYDPSCAPRQLSYLLSLFSNLDNIGIRVASIYGNTISNTPDTELAPFTALKPQGRLALYNFNWADTWRHIITSGSELRFRHMDLHGSATCATVLFEACGETLETLRLGIKDGAASELSCVRLSMDFC